MSEPKRSRLRGRAMLIGIVGCWALAFAYLLVLAKILPGRENKNDFSIYYMSGYMLRHGQNPYTTDFRPLANRLGLEEGGIERATDPPTFLLLVEPLSMLTSYTAYWTWTTINAIALFASIWLLLDRRYGLSGESRILFAGLGVMNPIVINHFYWGQNKVQVLLMLVLTMRWLEDRRDREAGLMLALSGLMRVFPLLLVVYLVELRRWRALRYTVLGLAVGALLTAAMIGFRTTISFVEGFKVLTASKWLSFDTNIALSSFVFRGFANQLGTNHKVTIDIARDVTSSIACVAVIVLSFVATVRAARNGDRDSRAFGLWVLTGVVVSPTAWFHYLTLAYIPFFRMAAAAGQGRANLPAILLAEISFALVWFLCIDGCVMEMGAWLRTFVLSRNNSALAALVSESGVLCLMLAYASAWLFAAVEQPPQMVPH